MTKRTHKPRHDVQSERIYAQLDDASRARIEAECVTAVSRAISRPAGAAGVAAGHVEG